ncbi:hypothetical protein JF544_08515 [Halobacillus kuroshimensis]|uniref:Uncharacterized protein n=1 Tax=Halobacillus kuroshimensis TaxID=302481 RepID=A0ABS3DVC7_9BACI|nr:hypothetical protein [Halobacillus kuroshimensis]MBN8235293.1 hypothetical protein [Halobacillus kuroshimensis]
MIDVMMMRAEKEIGMGCCGGICSDPDGLINMEDEFSHHDEERKKLQQLYLKTLEIDPDINIQFMDPRNLLAAAAYFWQQQRRGRIPRRRALTSLLLHSTYGAVFVNGEYIASAGRYEERLLELIES